MPKGNPKKAATLPRTGEQKIGNLPFRQFAWFCRRQNQRFRFSGGFFRVAGKITLLLLLSLGCAGIKNIPAPGPSKIYALKYGESNYRAALVNTLEKSAYVRLNWLFYLVEKNGAYTLIDTGFEDARLRKQFGLKKFKSARELLSMAGVKPEQISRVILTHSHFDHAGNLPHFKNSRIFIQAKEFSSLSDKSITSFLASQKQQGKLQLIDQPSAQAGEFEQVFTGGHTPGSQAVRLTTGEKTFLFTGDECYFQDACRARVPLPTVSAHSQQNNTRFLQSIGERDIILTGHETNLTGGRWLNDFIFLFE